MTIEIGYALVSAAVLAVLTYAGFLVPSLLLFDFGPTVQRVIFWIATAAAVLAFATRVVHVLWRFPRREGPPLPTAGQPSQPGRTSPDS